MPFLPVLFTSFVKLGSCRAVFFLFIVGVLFVSRHLKRVTICQEMTTNKAAIQKFLTGLAGLVYLIIDFHSLAEKLKKDVSGSFD